MSLEITENERLEEIERKLKALTGPRPQPMSVKAFEEQLGAWQILQRDSRRQAKAAADQEMQEQLRREAPARKRRQAEMAALQSQIAGHEAEIMDLKQQMRVLEHAPLG